MGVATSSRVESAAEREKAHVDNCTMAQQVHACCMYCYLSYPLLLPLPSRFAIALLARLGWFRLHCWQRVNSIPQSNWGGGKR